MTTDNQQLFLDRVGGGYNTIVRCYDGEMNNILKAYVVSRLINGENERMCIRTTMGNEWVHDFLRNIERLSAQYGNIRANRYKIGFNTNVLKLVGRSQSFRGTNTTLIIDCVGDGLPFETHGIIECPIVGIE